MWSVVTNGILKISRKKKKQKQKQKQYDVARVTCKKEAVGIGTFTRLAKILLFVSLLQRKDKEEKTWNLWKLTHSL
jgi:hypothetical protein